MYALLIVVLLMVLLVEEEEDALAGHVTERGNSVLSLGAALFPQPGGRLPDDDALPNPPSFAFFARLTCALLDSPYRNTLSTLLLFCCYCYCFC